MKKIREIEKEYGIKINDDPNITVVEYLKKRGFISLSKALKRLSK